MSAKSQVLGLAGCAVAVALGVGLTRYFRPTPPAPPKPPAVVEPTPPPAPPPPAPPAGAEKLVATPESVVLEGSTGQVSARMKLVWNGSGTPPAKVWVSGYFFQPGSSVSTEATVEVDRPFPSGSPGRTEVRFPLAAYAGQTPSTLFCVITASSQSADAARVPESRRSYDVKSATPVLVQAAARTGR